MTARVLVVDDSRVNIRLLSAKLIAEYYQVFEAENGFDALASAYIWQPDLILLDIMMPGMDGYECCSHLKAEKATSSIPVVMITALNEPDQRNRGLAAGADDFLTKPVDYDIFGARIKALVRLRRLLLDWQVQMNDWDADILRRDVFLSQPVLNGQALVRAGTVDSLSLRRYLNGEVLYTAFAATDQDLICLASVLDVSIYIMGLHLESSDPLRLISALRASDMTHDLPILAITPRSRKSQILTAFSLGASDCVFEPIDPYEIRLRIRNQLRRVVFRVNVRSDLDHAIRSALTDPLTGAYNRLYLHRYNQHLMNNPTRISVLMIDVDYFKKINDELGHVFGDRVLAQIAESLKRQVRGDDTVIRFGGEEFVVIMRDAGTLEATRIAERLRRAVEELEIRTGVAGSSASLTISVGIAQSGDFSYDLESVIAEADAALYQAKQNGRNRIEVAAEKAGSAI